MTVRELCERLARMPQDAEVVFCHEGHAEIFIPGEVFRVVEADDQVEVGTVVVDMTMDLDRSDAGPDDDEYSEDELAPFGRCPGCDDPLAHPPTDAWNTCGGCGGSFTKDEVVGGLE